jgi:hypothetical protein
MNKHKYKGHRGRGRGQGGKRGISSFFKYAGHLKRIYSHFQK